MINKLSDLFDWFMNNEYICTFGHCMAGVLPAVLCCIGYPTAGAIGLFGFIIYEGLEQFRYQQPKDDADQEIRQCLLGYFVTLVIILTVKQFV